jgi:putative membrane protein
MQGDDEMMMGGSILVGFILLIIFVLVVIGIVFAVIWIIRQNTGSFMNRTTYMAKHSQDEALDILKRRYASGEITKEQFNDMRKDIS